MARASEWSNKILALARGGKTEAAVAQIRVAPSVKELKQLVVDLQSSPDDHALREKIIKLVRELKPRPAAPEEAKRRMARGKAAFKAAANAADYADAAAEFEKAALAAPWLGDAYYNLAIAQDVPANASMLLIANPQVDLQPAEVTKIKQYVQKGGNLLWLIDTEPLRGLQPIAEALGLTLGPGTVVDPDAARVNAAPTIAVSASYGRHPVTDNFRLNTIYPFARQIGVSEGGEWRVARLVDVAPRGWVEMGKLDGGIAFDNLRLTYTLGSLALAVIPTVVPFAAFSLIALAVAFASVTAPVSNSSTSLILIVKTVSAVEPSADVARTVMFRMALSVSRFNAAAVVTIPVLASIAKLPLSLSNNK